MLFPNPDVLCHSKNVVMNRFCAMIFGFLLSFIFVLQIVSVYYYLGNNDQLTLYYLPRLENYYM